MKKRLIVFVLFLCGSVLFSGCVSNTDDAAGDNDLPAPNEARPEHTYQWSTMTHGPYQDMISFARSTDLLHWVDSDIVLARHASVPGAVVKDGVIFVYFVDVSVDGFAERLGLITSQDNGQTWSEKVFVSFEGIDEHVPVDPAPFLLDDGRIRLFYFDINEARSMPPGQDSSNKIYSAISSDGIQFVQEEGVRFSKKNIFDPAVVRVDGLWRMYVGYYEGDRFETFSAVSTDGVSFTSEGIAYRDGGVPDVFYLNGTYYLFTAGVDISTSSDGVSFSPTSYRFSSQLGLGTADPSVIAVDEGSYLMFFKTKMG